MQEWDKAAPALVIVIIHLDRDNRAARSVQTKRVQLDWENVPNITKAKPEWLDRARMLIKVKLAKIIVPKVLTKLLVGKVIPLAREIVAKEITNFM